MHKVCFLLTKKLGIFGLDIWMEYTYDKKFNGNIFLSQK